MPPKPPARERAWGTRYDTLQSSPPSPSIHRRSLLETSVHSPTTYTSFEATPDQKAAATSPHLGSHDSGLHDASIFVGSLPTSFGQAELTKRLTDHLSVHLPIKAIKVVRDSRGGVCAFIQCENPATVSTLLQELRMNPPRPFYGRFLRFEAAKAFRTILISYRLPAGVLSAAPYPDDPFESPKSSRFGNLKLPYAMRIFQAGDSRHLGISYDSEALASSGNTAEDSNSDCHRLFSQEGLLLNPLTYDDETIQRLAAAFGPLESFKECSQDLEVTKGHISPYPYPHDAPRSTEMSKAVWEIKWKDREHSVLALQTLRRVPFMTVTWAHQPSFNPALGRTDGSFPQSSWSPAPARHRSPIFDVPIPLEGDQNSSIASSSSLLVPATPSAPGNVTATSADASSSTSVSSKESGTTSPRLCFEGATDSRGEARTCWADQVAELDVFAGSIGRTSSSPNRTSTTTTNHASDALAALSLGTPGSGVLAADLHHAAAFVTAIPDIARTQATPDAATGRAPLSRGSHVGSTPGMAGDRGMCALPLRSSHPPPRDVDPNTIFVGGLSIDTADEWDEHRLRSIFGRYGTIENVQVVKSLHKRTCFAFVQFANPDIAGRAVQAEHNQVHHGRHLRVQLRERVSFRPRTDWRLGRGRGRNSFGGSLHTQHDALEIQNVSAPRVNAAHASDVHNSSSSSANANSTQECLHNLGDGALRRKGSHMSAHSSTSSLSSDTTKVPSIHYEVPNGPSNGTSSSPATSAPSQASTTAPMPPPPPMNVGYFIPPPWVQPYPPPYSYPVPVVAGYAHPGYAYPHVPPMQSAVFAPEAATAMTSSGSRGSVASTASDPAIKVANSDGRGQSSLTSVTQPPLRATGFIQNEQGTLIPVYQREALDQYMANAHNTQPPPPTTTSVAGTVPAATNLALWPTPRYPVYAGTYPVATNPVHHAGLPPPPQASCWIPGGQPYAVAPFQPTETLTGFGHPFPSVSPAPGVPRTALQVPHAPNQPPFARRGGFSPSPRRYNRRDNQPQGGGRPSGQ
ncbi:hypothetical protein OH77DRAFT_429923 [Trametes cingulata]|nr:hypothetical protein OH77DRAFT_429923 [Trametes cingulata]